MTARAFCESDAAAIRAMPQTDAFGYPFPDLSKMEALQVIEDDDGQVIAACAAEKILQLYFWSADMSPHAKLHVLRVLHSAMIRELLGLGYHEANAFIPPSLAARFGRRLMRTFQWRENWRSFYKRF